MSFFFSFSLNALTGVLNVFDNKKKTGYHLYEADLDPAPV